MGRICRASLVGIAALVGAVGIIGVTPASADCTEDYCDPPPHPMPSPAGAEVDCGSVRVWALKYDKTVYLMPCVNP